MLSGSLALGNFRCWPGLLADCAGNKRGRPDMRGGEGSAAQRRNTRTERRDDAAAAEHEGSTQGTSTRHGTGDDPGSAAEDWRSPIGHGRRAHLVRITRASRAARRQVGRRRAGLARGSVGWPARTGHDAGTPPAAVEAALGLGSFGWRSCWWRRLWWCSASASSTCPALPGDICLT